MYWRLEFEPQSQHLKGPYLHAQRTPFGGEARLVCCFFKEINPLSPLYLPHKTQDTLAPSAVRFVEAQDQTAAVFRSFEAP